MNRFEFDRIKKGDFYDASKCHGNLPRKKLFNECDYKPGYVRGRNFSISISTSAKTIRKKKFIIKKKLYDQ